MVKRIHCQINITTSTDNVEFFVEKCMNIVGRRYMTIYSGSERLITLFSIVDTLT